jgi:hypothetical protein
MRRPTAALAALAILAAGAGCSGDDDDAEATTAATPTTATAPADGGAPATPTTVREVAVDLAGYTAAMRRDPYGTGTERLAALESRVEITGARITALEGVAGSPGMPSAATVRNLREAEAHLRDYLSHGREGDEIAMQKDVWRYLWSLHRLPESFSVT